MPQLMIKPDSSDNLKSLIRLALESELRIMRLGIGKTGKKLKELEKKFGTDSRDFYEQFSRGETGDEFEYIRWAGEYETLRQLETDFRELQDVELCL